MPTYQYACKQCGHQFEAVQSFSDASLTDCPECAGPLRKLFGSVGVIFKGSGFYRNDSRSGSSSTTASSGKASSSTTSSESSSSSSDKSTGSSSTSTSSTTPSSGSSGSSGGSGGSSTPAAKAS